MTTYAILIPHTEHQCPISAKRNLSTKIRKLHQGNLEVYFYVQRSFFWLGMRPKHIKFLLVLEAVFWGSMPTKSIEYETFFH